MLKLPTRGAMGSEKNWMYGVDILDDFGGGL